MFDILTFVLFFLVGGLLWNMIKNTIIALILSSLGIVYLRLLYKRRKSASAKECCRAGSAVKFVWKGDPGLPYKFGVSYAFFLFRNKNYALDFAHGNNLIIDEMPSDISKDTIK